MLARATATVSTTLRRPVSVDLEDLGKNKTLPLNTHGVGKAGKQPPFIGKVVSIERLGGRDKERDVSHIVIDTGDQTGCIAVFRQQLGASACWQLLARTGQGQEEFLITPPAGW